jgi:hypothetical protein
MRKFWGLILMACLALVLLAGIFRGSSEARSISKSSPQSPAFTPFVVSKRVTHFSGAKVTKEADFTIARRMDGSLVESFMVTGSDSPDGNEREAVFIWDIPSRHNVMLEPFTKSVMTQVLSPKEIANFLSSQKACSEASLPAEGNGASTEQLLGHAVVRVEEQLKVVDTVSWVAPDLDCFPLKQTFTFLDPQHAGIRHEDVVTKIEERDPPSSMFAVPSDYTERSPAELQAEYSRKYGGVKFFGTTVDDAERHYRQHQE